MNSETMTTPSTPNGLGRRLSIADTSALSLGAAIFGTGGGGDPYIGRLALQRQIELTGEPLIVPLTAIADDAVILTLGMAGAPMIALEKLLSESFADSALRRFEVLTGRPVDAILPLEVGGVNSLMPMLTACRTGLPVIDADGMGRAFPSTERTSFGIGGVSPYPVLIINEHGESVLVDTKSHVRGEKIMRDSLITLGGCAMATSYPMTGREVKDLAIGGTITTAIDLGHAVQASRAEKRDPLQAITEFLMQQKVPTFSSILFKGKVTDLNRFFKGGYNVGNGTLEGPAGTATFGFQNEYLYFRVGDRLSAIVPDLISFLDEETGEPILCEHLRYGQRIAVLGAACKPPFRTPAGLSVCGPRSFNLDEDYVPIELMAL